MAKFADDTSEHILGENSWTSATERADISKTKLQSLTHANLLALDSKKSSVQIPIFTAKNKNLPGADTVKASSCRQLGVMIDSNLTFEVHANKILSKLHQSSQILRAIRPLIPADRLKEAAQSIINSCLYFSAEIIAFCDEKLLRKIQLAVQNIGRFVLKRTRTEHISNFQVYSEIGIYPIKIICYIQTLLFWKKEFEHSTHSILKRNLVSAFGNQAQTSFKSPRQVTKPIQILIKAYSFYKSHCLATGLESCMFIDKNFNKDHLDSVFKRYRLNEKDFVSVSSQNKRFAPERLENPVLNRIRMDRPRPQSYSAPVLTARSKRKHTTLSKRSKKLKAMESNFSAFLI